MKKERIRLLLRRAALIIGSVVICATLILFLFGKHIEGRVKKIIVSEINKQVITEIKVDDIELSLLRRFPYAALRFYNVDILSTAPGKSESLLKAESIYLQFSIFDLIKSRYILKRIEVNSGEANISIYEDESDNFHIFRTSSDTTVSDFELKLEKVLLSRLNIHFRNEAAGIELHTLAEKAWLRGKLSEEQYRLSLSGDFFINSLLIENKTALSNRPCKLAMKLDVSTPDGMYSFREGKLSLSNLDFDVSGKVQLTDDISRIDMKLDCSGLPLEKLLDELPATWKESLSDYRISGIAGISALIRGDFGGNRLPALNAALSLANGLFRHSKTNMALDDISLEAAFNNGNLHNLQSSSLVVRSFSGRLGGRPITAKGSMIDLSHPAVELEAEANLNLADIAALLDNSGIRELSGNISGNIAFKGKTGAGGSFTVAHFLASTTSGDVTLEKAAFRHSASPYRFDDINGNLKFSNNDVVINNLHLKVENQQILLSGYFRNLIPHLLSSQNEMELKASLSSPYINVKSLLLPDDSKPGQGDTIRFALPAGIRADLQCNIEKLDFEPFTCTSLETGLKLRNKQLMFSTLRFNTMDGRVDSRGMIDAGGSGGILVSGEARLSGINVQKLFYQLNNFDQQSLTDRHISGTLDGSLQFAGIWDLTLKADEKSLFATADFSIVQGRLMNFKPLLGLSRFVSVEDLADVRFSELKNRIEIKNRQILIPLMEIQSNALNLKTSGTHDFDNNINYHLQIKLSELLSKKAGAKKENVEFGEVIDDGGPKTTLFVLVSGTLDNPRFQYDKVGVKQKLKQDIKQEKKELKEILNKEFGWFHSDTTLAAPRMRESTRRRQEEKKEIKEQEKGKFIIEWEEEEDTD